MGRDAVGQRAGDLVELCPNAGDDVARIGAAQSQNEPFDGFGLAALSHGTVPSDRADLDVGHVRDRDGDAVVHGDDDVLQVVERDDAPLGADEQSLFALD